MSRFRIEISIEAFGYAWEKAWGNPWSSSKIVQIDAVILTVGVGIGIFV